ncbi:MAG TPA: LCP family protein [Gaiellaceae bacterium]|nr:LCP family protein [Gaiellaceae bacterium]
MRTTLKRGIGRGATLTGNGHAVLPPATVTAMRRYRQPPKQPVSTGRLFVRVLGWLVLAIAVVVSGLAGGVYLYGHETLNAIAAHSKPVRDAQKILSQIPSPSQPAIALVAGYDHRAGDGASYAGSNSDTVMLLRADPTNDTLSLLSFPRDLNVPIYCSGDTVYTHSRINAAWALCPGDEGPLATVDTVEHLTGLQINYLITLDFHGFKEIVNRLHGVYMDVDRRYYIPPNSGVSAINLHPGYQKLDGGQALQYVRFRHTDSDIYRNARQQLFLDALKSRLAGSLKINDIPKIIGAIKGNVEIARGGGGAPGITEIQAYAGLAYGLPAGHLFRNSISPGDLQNLDVGGAAELTTSQSVIDQVVYSFLHPDVTLPTRANDQALGIKTHTKPSKKLKPAEITTLVMNAGIVAGRAANTDYLLRQLGYTTKLLPASIPANAPQTFDTNIYYDPVQPHAKQAAEQLKPLFGGHTDVVPLSPAIAPYAQQAGNPMTVVAFGTSFDGTLATPPPPAQTPEKQAPSVSDGVSATDYSLKAVASQVPFTIMQPHEIAAGSRLSSDEGVRPYKPLENQHALVMTFLEPNGIAYWQIEETTWNSAPILAHPTARRTIGGRHFSLYTVGGHIHMVVVRQGKASYWVVNTLLDELSNETMLAIAKSLQPLAK